MVFGFPVRKAVIHNVLIMVAGDMFLEEGIINRFTPIKPHLHDVKGYYAHTDGKVCRVDKQGTPFQKRISVMSLSELVCGTKQ